jgi:hypothetical protein
MGRLQKSALRHCHLGHTSIYCKYPHPFLLLVREDLFDQSISDQDDQYDDGMLVEDDFLLQKAEMQIEVLVDLLVLESETRDQWTLRSLMLEESSDTALWQSGSQSPSVDFGHLLVVSLSNLRGSGSISGAAGSSGQPPSGAGSPFVR